MRAEAIIRVTIAIGGDPKQWRAILPQELCFQYHMHHSTIEFNIVRLPSQVRLSEANFPQAPPAEKAEGDLEYPTRS